MSMDHFMLALNAVSPLFFSMAAGFLSQKTGILTRQDVPKINKVAFQVFLPCLLFYNVYTSDLSAAVRPKLILFAVIGVLIVFTASVLGVLRFVPQPERRGVISQAIFRSNYVIMGIPIAQALVGRRVHIYDTSASAMDAQPYLRA